MATKLKSELDLEAIAARLEDPEDVDDATMAKVQNALGTSSREDSAALVRSEPQAAKLVAKIIGTAPIPAAEGAVSPTENERVAATLYGGGKAKKTGVKAKVRF
jgi:hypothetical protein